MGGKKLLLPFADTSVGGAALRTLLQSQLGEVIVVLGHDAEAVRQHLLSVVSRQWSRNSKLETQNLRFVVNAHYKEGMFSSAICGLDAASPSAQAFLISLADLPGVTSQVVDTLLAAFRNVGADGPVRPRDELGVGPGPAAVKRIAVPTYRGRRGHPLLFHRQYEEEVRCLEPQSGLRGLLSLHPDEVLEVPVDCPGVVRDIDYWEDYAAQRP